MSDDFIETMWAQYAIETEEHIEGIETLLVAADSGELSADEISSLFRAFHSLKGLSRVMELGALESVTHRSEDLLGLVREGVTTLNKATVDLLLRSLDAIKGLRDIAVASRSDGEKPAALNQELEAAFRKASGGGAEEPAAPAPAPVAEPAPAPVPAPTPVAVAPEVVAAEPEAPPPPQAEPKSLDEGTDDHSIFLRQVKNGLPVLEQLAASIAAKDDAEHILAVANDIRRPLTWMVRAATKLGYMGITRRIQEILEALPTESSAIDRASGDRLVDGIVALLTDLRTLGETTGNDLGGESLMNVLSRTLRESLEALFNDIDANLQTVASSADGIDADMATTIARDFSRVHAYMSSLFLDAEFGLPLMLADAYGRNVALHDEALHFTREAVELMRGVCRSKDRRPLAKPDCVAQQTQLAQRIRDYLWANEAGSGDGDASASVEDIKVFLAKQEIPIELAELLSTENTRELMQLMQEGAYAFVILAHLESSEEIATAFLTWTAERGRIITNRTVFLDGDSWYEMLFVSKADIGVIEAELLSIDPDESLVKLRGQVGEGRKIPPLLQTTAMGTVVADTPAAVVASAPEAAAAAPAATASAAVPAAAQPAQMVPQAVAQPALVKAAAGTALPAAARPVAPVAAAANVIRVPGEMLDQFMNQIGEMVLVRGQLAHVIADQRLREQAIALRRAVDSGAGESAGTDHDQFQRLMDLLEEQNRRLQETDALIQGALSRLQDSVMGLRVVPVELVFKRFPRMVRDLAQAQGKQIRLELTGQEVKIDKAMVESLADPLLHMIRNSVDHGIETAEDRKLTGKPEEAVIRIQAEQQGGRILIRVSDDGKGIDPERVRRKAVERGLIKEEDSLLMSRDEILKFIFRAGFSTAEVVTETSGRGVGMDVVRTNVMRLGGNIHLDSELGRGTIFTMQMPLSAAVQEVLLVRTAGQTLAMPGRYVAELVEIQQSEVQSVKGRTAIMLRGNFLPIVRLEELLGFPRTDDDNHHFVVVLSDGQRTLGVSVDEFLGRQELFTKDIHPRLSALPGVGGASILGDGRVVLILDGAAIYRLAENIGNKVELPLAA